MIAWLLFGVLCLFLLAAPALIISHIAGKIYDWSTRKRKEGDGA